MKRTEKTALLKRVLAGEASQQTAKQLHEAVARQPVIFIVRHGANGAIQPHDEVTVGSGPNQETILYRDLDEYARRNYLPVVIVVPHNGR